MGKPVDSSGLDYGLQNTAYQYYCNQMNKYWVMEKEMTRLYIALEDQKMLYRPVEEMGISGKPYLSSAFGYRSDPETGVIQWHGQIDIAGNKPWNNGSEGTVVLNTKDGYVLQTVAKENSGSWGNTVVVLHDNGMVSRYSHLETIGVRVEQRIWARDTIGIMGNTGYSKGIHLDYQLFPSYGAYLRHNPRAGIKTSINANLNFYHPYSPY